MVMDTLQIRLGTGLVEQIDKLVKQGIYSSRSDAIREAVRHFFWHSQAGTMKYKENSVKLARKAREKLSKENVNLQEINTL
ncbi:MAG TPA: ribbon-helix-helix domain-containing protein [Candidatus Nanoarchaeia archaeon]|nr:ribbon-helix-helix domain-containing protein [Candidatus Nanoarchaeia archaeon]